MQISIWWFDCCFLLGCCFAVFSSSFAKSFCWPSSFAFAVLPIAAQLLHFSHRVHSRRMMLARRPSFLHAKRSSLFDLRRFSMPPFATVISARCYSSTAHCWVNESFFSAKSQWTYFLHSAHARMQQRETSRHEIIGERGECDKMWQIWNLMKFVLLSHSLKSCVPQKIPNRFIFDWSHSINESETFRTHHFLLAQIKSDLRKKIIYKSISLWIAVHSCVSCLPWHTVKGLQTRRNHHKSSHKCFSPCSHASPDCDYYKSIVTWQIIVSCRLLLPQLFSLLFLSFPSFSHQTSKEELLIELLKWQNGYKHFPVLPPELTTDEDRTERSEWGGIICLNQKRFSINIVIGIYR